MKHWYAVYTKSGWEKKVIRLLYKQSVENYYPLNKTVCQNGYRRMMVEEPLFKSYVFVHIEEKEQVSIRRTEGVINFVYRVDQPVVIKTEEITAMQDFLDTHKNVVLERVSLKLLDKSTVGDVVLTNRGADMNPAVNKAVLHSLGYALVAEPGTQGAEIIAPSAMPYFKKPFYQYGAAVR